MNLGTIQDPGFIQPANALNAGQVRWFAFTLADAVSVASTRHLDIDLPGAVVGSTPANDTEMALFDSQGYLIAEDDDSGPGFSSQLSFGLGINPPILDGEAFGGANGTLAPGLYYLAVGAYDLTFGPFWQAATSSSVAGSFDLRFRLGVPPCPADFNDDGGIDGADVQAFFAAWEIAGPAADVNQDGGIDGADVGAFFAVWEAGGC